MFSLKIKLFSFFVALMMVLPVQAQSSSCKLSTAELGFVAMLLELEVVMAENSMRSRFFASQDNIREVVKKSFSEITKADGGGKMLSYPENVLLFAGISGAPAIIKIPECKNSDAAPEMVFVCAEKILEQIDVNKDFFTDIDTQYMTPAMRQRNEVRMQYCGWM